MPEPSRLQRALAQACTFARAHGVETPIAPRDFGVQRSESGLTHATYIDSSHVVSVLVDRYGNGHFAVGEVDWIHDQADEDREPCDWCEDDAPEYFRGRPLVDVHLPGDAPEAVSA